MLRLVPQGMKDASTALGVHPWRTITNVIYPAAPQFLLMGPTYAKALVAPAMVYSTSPKWKFPFAPHDVGVYPQANGQVYGGGETSRNDGVPLNAKYGIVYGWSVTS